MGAEFEDEEEVIGGGEQARFQSNCAGTKGVDVSEVVTTLGYSSLDGCRKVGQDEEGMCFPLLSVQVDDQIAGATTESG